MNRSRVFAGVPCGCATHKLRPVDFTKREGFPSPHFTHWPHCSLIWPAKIADWIEWFQRSRVGRYFMLYIRLMLMFWEERRLDFWFQTLDFSTERLSQTKVPRDRSFLRLLAKFDQLNFILLEFDRLCWIFSENKWPQVFLCRFQLCI